MLGRGGPWISLAYLSAFNHILTPWSRVEPGALAPDPIPGDSILADIKQIVTLFSCEASGANTDISYLLLSIRAGP
jgi:hypothetical protein